MNPLKKIGEYFKKPEPIPKEEWQKKKQAIDKIFKNTQDRRDQMTKDLENYRGKIWNEKTRKKSSTRAIYNLLFTTVSAIAPLITDSKPKTRVVPVAPYHQKVTWAYNNAINYAYEILDIMNQLSKLVVWGLVCGHGIVKVYFDPTKQSCGELAMEIEDPRDFFIAPGYDDIWKAPYCGTRKKKPLSWVRETFPEADIDVKGINHYTVEGDQDETDKAYKYSDATSFDDENTFVLVYEIWARDGEMITIADEHGNPVKDENGKEKKEKRWPNGKLMYFTENEQLGCLEAPDCHGYPPFVEFIDYYNPGMFDGISEADQTRGLNKEVNRQLDAIATWANGHGKKNYVVDSNAGMDMANIKNTFHEGGNFYSADFKNDTTMPIRPIDDGNMSNDVYWLFEKIPEIVEDVSGVADVTKGIAGKRERQSASELAILSDAANTRTRQKIRNLEWTLKRITYLLLRLMQQYYVDGRYVRYNRDGNVIHQKFPKDKEDMKKISEPDYDITDRFESDDWVEQFEKMNDRNLRKMFKPDELQQMDDYVEFVKQMSGKEGLDPVYFPFDIEIQTNSTLPMDKQSLANMALRLHAQKAIDAEALLETLGFPNAKEITERLERKIAKAQGGKR